MPSRPPRANPARANASSRRDLPQSPKATPAPRSKTADPLLDAIAPGQLQTPRAPAFDRATAKQARARRAPVGEQESIVVGVLRELERKPEALQRVTPILRNASQLVAQLREAHHWSAEWTLAEAWFQYVTHKRATAWHEAIVSLDAFREAQAIMKRFDGLDEKDLPTLDAFFKVREEMYRRAAQTRQATTARRRSDATSRGRK